MPRIDPDHVSAVVTLLNGPSPVGTAFVIRLPDAYCMGLSSYYLVTCDHCTTHPVTARFNTGMTLRIAPDDWAKPAGGEDLAAVDVTAIVSESKGAIGRIDVSAVEREMPQVDLGVDLYMLGLLLDEADIGQNVPRARFGNLAAFASDLVPAEQGNGHLGPVHLGDMRSRTGFSGSPVFAYVEDDVLSDCRTKAWLLGVHSGQHKERVKLYGVNGYTSAEVTSAMTRIVPAYALFDFLYLNPSLEASRAPRRASEGVPMADLDSKGYPVTVRWKRPWDPLGSHLLG